ncbi:Type I restriction-modification system methyltransferase subunit [Mycobacteroides abscessus subsp. abscessus]|uniref:N-6 DNA methylase n=1 Tax=Mycobacteroides abscessus TaxID=36809 RepID=UPI00092B2796|nr:N-6 DNA methylase [Mycobacteroides abscessus]MDM2175293.1 type I restriction-modification system subunit M [Mycobacteroides abscessus]MDM2176321.1 type I restriction-modification system subunit M [Mycobacteroides abscessus]MDM2204886.1 type I restriction-modification system subunit M [Mycobacteroides abscessus]MDM2210471.1 type I restriction-modification system subunit M [Mycobacteroides abscessus]MDM2215805.1 type I restriction-modification system subunit M [Mycobacteroides abscessus]
MSNNEFGDFQTPPQLAQLCVELLSIPPNARVLEPTCGLGSFLHAAAQVAPSTERIGIEIQPDHAKVAEAHATILVDNIFHMKLFDDVKWQTDGPLFIIGNPPWVTSSELNRMDSDNLPQKENFKGARGLDALLGGSNFDVCEYIILKMLDEFRREPFTLGMLCKTQVARNVIEYAASAGYPLEGAATYRIDAMHWFNAAVDACWFVVHSNPSGKRDYTAAAHHDLRDARETPKRFGVVDGRLVSDVDRYASLAAADGKSPYEWRSGLKHDAASVFELLAKPAPTTRDGAVLDVESDYLYPFLKSTDVFRGRHGALSRWVIVPQMSFGADTAHLEHTAPNLWRYLDANGGILDGRKSSIYRNRPRFSVFGHGDYTFAPYKVVVSGLHKEPVFRLVPPMEGKPVVLDDTCYFLPFDNGWEAATTWALLSSPECRDLIESLVFWDSKRPITKKLLARIDLNKLPVDAEAVLHAARIEAERLGVDSGDLPSQSPLDILGGERDTASTLF